MPPENALNRPTPPRIGPTQGVQPIAKKKPSKKVSVLVNGFFLKRNWKNEKPFPSASMTPNNIRKIPVILAKNSLYTLKKLPTNPATTPKIMNAIISPREKNNVIENAFFFSLNAYARKVGARTKPHGEVNVKSPPKNAIRSVIDNASSCW